MPSNPISIEGDLAAQAHASAQGTASSGPAADQAAPLSGDALLEQVAGDLYGISAMLLGEGEEAIGLIERVVSNPEVPTCCGYSQVRHKARLLLAADAITVLGRPDSSATRTSLAAPADDSGPTSCIEEDDISAAGVTSDEFERMLAGPERHRLGDWLQGLSVSQRVIFVLRAIAGLCSNDVAALLAKYGGTAAQGWTPQAVRGSFRQALCSLASQLIQASATR